MQIFIALLATAIASIVITYACNSFEEAAEFLGQNMPEGVKGATLHAIGSSLPELLTTTFLLFLYHDLDGFSAGIATCAGSAIFNSIIIPSLCIIAVLMWGVKSANGTRKKIKYIEIKQSTILRDGFFLILSSLVLIYFLSNTILTWQMGLGLIGIYLLYFGYLFFEIKKHKKSDNHAKRKAEKHAHISERHEKGKDKSFLKALYTFDFNKLLFDDQALTHFRAWVVLACSVFVIAVACYFLAESVYLASDALNVAPYFTAVILAAAATSVPDTILSVKDSLNGEFDDAIANAFGSNIFDIAVGIGLPLFIYSLFFGNVTLAASTGSDGSAIQALQIFLLIITSLVLLVFLLNRKVGLDKAILLLALYGVWLLYIIGSAFNIGWVQTVFFWI